MAEDRRGYEDLIDRLARVEAIQSVTDIKLTTHISEEEHKLDKVFSAIKEVSHNVAEIKDARNREKGFWAGAAFVCTAIGGAVVYGLGQWAKP